MLKGLKLTVRVLAKHLAKTDEEMIFMLKEVGILVENSDSPLTNVQIYSLKRYIKEIKFKERREKRIYVYVKGKKYELKEKLGDGGEGQVYRIENKKVCKIYNKVDKLKEEKLRLMIDRNLEYEGICFPKDIVYNLEGKVIGYIMNEAKGAEMQKSLMGKKQIESYFPSFKKRDMVQLGITILKKIEYLHGQKIILGDINPRNILVCSPKEVYFVDTDSYQIESFPCCVGSTVYTAPEIQRRDFNGFLRSYGNENFAIATLLFMIMIPGKPPYSKKNGEDIVKNILNMDFSYPMKDGENENIPEGLWQYCWSHLPLYIKRAFYKTFKKGEDYNKEKERIDASKWRTYMEKYLKFIDEGKIEKNDEMSLEIFPTRYKKQKEEIDYEEEGKYRLIFRKLLNI